MPDVYLALRTVIANTQMLSERNPGKHGEGG